jgi:hypothetical protein
MVISMMARLEKTKNMALEGWSTMAKVSTTDSGIVEGVKERDCTLMQTKTSIQAVGGLARSTVREHTYLMTQP